MRAEKSDSLTVIFNDESSVTESDEDKPGMIPDYDKNRNLASLVVQTPPGASPKQER